MCAVSIYLVNHIKKKSLGRPRMCVLKPVSYNGNEIFSAKRSNGRFLDCLYLYKSRSPLKTSQKSPSHICQRKQVYLHMFVYLIHNYFSFTPQVPCYISRRYITTGLTFLPQAKVPNDFIELLLLVR